jgi:hypothetical protein
MADDMEVKVGQKHASAEVKQRVKDAMKSALEKELSSGAKVGAAEAFHGSSSVMGAQ